MSTVRRRILKAAVFFGGVAAARAIIRRMKEFRLHGRTVLITGGSRGLGLLLAREFASQGARIVICARDHDELDVARVDLASRGAEVLALPCDVTDREQVDRMVREVRDEFGPVEVLVNNAGLIQVGPIEEMTLADFEEAMRVHLWAAIYTSLAVIPDMQARHEGRIVNIASIGGKVAVPHLIPYSASKFALAGFSEALRAELAKDGIAVVTVFPGLMRTGSAYRAHFKGQNKKEYTLFSLLNGLPVFSMDAGRAAKQIVTACKRGYPEVVLSPQAKFGAAFHALFPGLTTDILGLVGRALPGPGGIGIASIEGRHSETPVTRSFLTGPLQRAARANNEVRG